MAFESLSESYEFTINDFPPEWLPLIYLYDPDLPLFPVQYFHFLDPKLSSGHRPGERDRLFGFIHHINLNDSDLTVYVVINKELKSKTNEHFVKPLKDVVINRLGLGNPVGLSDIQSSLFSGLSNSNNVVEELWYSVIDGSFGKSLPFGSIWDGVFGLVRYVASFRSDGGRKGELIQTYVFTSEFGEKIQAGSNIHVDFYLLPTYEELTDVANPLNLFSKIALLVSAADEFVRKYCSNVNIGAHIFSVFERTRAMDGQLTNEKLFKLITESDPAHHKVLLDNFGALNRGAHRSIIFLMMLHDLRKKMWNPETLLPQECGAMYSELRGTYQAPKVIQLYAQQCFGNQAVLPIDNWVESFLIAPLEFRASRPKNYYEELFNCCDIWGKLERLIWMAAQSRKVHASVCSEILWCVRYGESGKGARLRGANPLSCKLCESQLRKRCPSYKNISDKIVAFNDSTYHENGAAFNIVTSLGNNHTRGQNIEYCEGGKIIDTYSPIDRVEKFTMFPSSNHKGENLKVSEFISKY